MDDIEQENSEEEEEQQEKIPLFSCEKMSKYYLIPFITPIFCGSGNVLIKKYIEYNGKLDIIKFYLAKIIFFLKF